MSENNLLYPDNGIKRTGVTPIRETDLGIYVWKRACNGKILANEYGDVFNITSVFGDIQKMARLKQDVIEASKEYHFDPEGTPVFWDVHRCTEEEYLEQVYEMMEGRMPDTNVRLKK